jgi:hypothetical protein
MAAVERLLGERIAIDPMNGTCLSTKQLITKTNDLCVWLIAAVPRSSRKLNSMKIITIMVIMEIMVIELRVGTQGLGSNPAISTTHVTCLVMVVE